MAHADEWSEVVATATADYLKGATNLTLRERIVFAMLQRRNRVKFRQSGTELRWQAKYGLPEVSVYTGGAIDYQPSEKHKQVWVDWRGYLVPDTMDEKEFLMNRGNSTQLINRYKSMMPDMEASLMDKFDQELFVNGATSTDRFGGLETFCAYGGTPNVADKLVQPDATYAGYSTTPGAIAGNWTSGLSTSPSSEAAVDWPSGHGDSQFDWWSPRLMNYGSTSWGTAATTWLANCERCIRQAVMWTRLTGGRAGKLDLILLAEDLLVDYGNKQAGKQQINVTPNREMVELGFEGYTQEGVAIATEFGMEPDSSYGSIGYGLNLDRMSFHSMYDQLFGSHGPDFDNRTYSYLWSLATFGNWRFDSPKYFCKFASYATA
jgi:hypothetical protein